jgi:hypothetical protein
MANQLTKSLRDFLFRSGTMVLSRRAAASPPVVPLTIRVGAAGHLGLPPDTGIEDELMEIFAALRGYAESANRKFHQSLFGEGQMPPAQLRLISQLACGFDQLAAGTAVRLGYRLQTVLPGDRDVFARSVEHSAGEQPGANAGSGADATARFRDLLGQSERILELDRDGGDDLSLADYAQAGAVILDHSDLLIVAILPQAGTQLGGTVWLERLAEERELPVLHLPIERLSESKLYWTADGKRQRRDLYDANSRGISPEVFAAALDVQIFGPPRQGPYAPPGWFERRYASQLDPERNASYWHERWRLPQAADPALLSLASVREQIDSEFGSTKIWSDNRATAYGEMLRGSFIVSVFLGLLAIGGSVLGLFFRDFGTFGKSIDFICILLIVWLAHRSHRFHWRSSWINIRQLERLIDQAAWLNLLGRSYSHVQLPLTARFDLDDTALWGDMYFRAVARAASIPTARFTDNYLVGVHKLMLHNLVGGQLRYFGDQSKFQQNANNALIRWMTIFMVAAAVAVSGYLIVAAASQFKDQIAMVPAWKNFARHDLCVIQSRWAAVSAWLGILLPAVVAALAAMRNFGEYEQLAVRYREIRDALEKVSEILRGRLPGAQQDIELAPLRSSMLARKTLEATDILLQEVAGWRSIFRSKNIEVV